MHKRLPVIYFLTTLLFCCVLLYAGKAPASRYTKLVLKTSNPVVERKAGDDMSRFIPSVLLV
jgi:hypothetical protein